MFPLRGPFVLPDGPAPRGDPDSGGHFVTCIPFRSALNA